MMTRDSEPLYLCLDQGGSSSRALVFDSRGQLLASAQQGVHTWRPQPGRVEQGCSELVSSLRQTAQEVVASLSVEQQQCLRGCALVTQRSSMVCWNRDSGEGLTPILSWQDTRAAQKLKASHIDKQLIYQLTGLMPNAHYGASKMRWCLDTLEPVAEAVASNSLVMAPLASYLLFKLLAEQPLLVDPANASRTMLCNINTGQWDEQLLQLFSIPQECLPEIVPTHYHYGTLELDGFSLPMLLVNGDQCAAAFAQGWPLINTAYINMGTGAFVYSPIAEPLPSSRRNGLLSSIFLWDERPHTMLEGTVNGAGSALDGFASDNGIDNIAKSLQRVLMEPQTPPLFLNGEGGLGSPFWRSDFVSRFIGDGDTDARLQAVAESIVFLLLKNIETMQEAGLDLHELVISGGLSRLGPFCQMLSDLTGLPVVRPEETEATARGAAFLLSSNKDRWARSSVDRFTPVVRRDLEGRYRRWVKALVAG